MSNNLSVARGKPPVMSRTKSPTAGTTFTLGWRRHPGSHHVSLKTTRLSETIVWYATVLGLEVTHAHDGGAWMSNEVPTWASARG
jgi:hypothetical protein